MAVRPSKVFVFADTDSGGIVHIANIKGGVGKSTVATNLSAAFSKKGPALLIDLDAQGSATHALGKDPAEFSFSSWDLFRQRFASEVADRRSPGSVGARLTSWARRAESLVLSPIVGRGDVTSLAVNISPCLDLIPANADLFHSLHFYHVQNFLYNLELCRSYYKYIVLDTPSVWNILTKTLYLRSDLNLIPVTLNALSTKSLRDYLVHVLKLSNKNSYVRIRIVKNEVFGTQDSKIKGKTRTMYENRRFLDALCEQVMVRSDAGISLLPQAMMFDLEIPESATVRDAQDEGKPIHDFRQYSSAARAFDELAKRVQYVLNTQVSRAGRLSLPTLMQRHGAFVKVAAVLLFCALLGANPPASNPSAPRPLAPQQLVESTSQAVISHVFKVGESAYRLAKFAICRFRATVPSGWQIKEYAWESVDVHNKTRLPGEPRVTDPDRVPAGTVINFYPPANVQNPREKQLVPVYLFFASLVDDPFSYVTGDWCQRGSGGGTPHYGIDVAANLGSSIFSPIDGIAFNNDSKAGGRSVGVVKEGTVLFFMHMDKRFFASGSAVKKGEAVGTVGLTGATSGPHVHVGYGIRSPSHDGIEFGGANYKVTDPKLFFYRQEYVKGIAER